MSLVDVDKPILQFLEVRKDKRIVRISTFLVTLIGVHPYLFEALGLSVKGTKILIISLCPLHATQNW